MSEQDLNKILKLRRVIIGVYNSLEHKSNDFSQVPQKAVAEELEGFIKIIDDIIKDKVTFG